MSHRWAVALVLAGISVVSAVVARSPGHAAGLPVDPDPITVQVIANPPP